MLTVRPKRSAASAAEAKMSAKQDAVFSDDGEVESSDESEDEYGVSSSSSRDDDDELVEEDEEDPVEEEEEEEEEEEAEEDEEDEEAETVAEFVVRPAKITRGLAVAPDSRLAQAFLYADQADVASTELLKLLHFVKNAELGSPTAVLSRLRLARLCFRAGHSLDAVQLDEEATAVRASFDSEVDSAVSVLVKALNAVGGVRPRVFDEPFRTEVARIFLGYMASVLPQMCREDILRGAPGEVLQAASASTVGNTLIVSACRSQLNKVLQSGDRVLLRTFVGAIVSRVDATVASGRLSDTTIKALRDRVRSESGDRAKGGKLRLGQALRNNPPEKDETKVVIKTEHAVLVAHMKTEAFNRMTEDAIIAAFKSSDERVAEYMDKLGDDVGVLVPTGKMSKMLLVPEDNVHALKFSFDVFWNRGGPVVADSPMDIWASANAVVDELNYLVVGGDGLYVSLQLDGKAYIRGGAVHSRIKRDGRMQLCETKRTAYLKRLKRRLLLAARRVVSGANPYGENKAYDGIFIITTLAEWKKKTAVKGKPKEAKQKKDAKGGNGKKAGGTR